MPDMNDESDIFSPPDKMPRSLRDAASILGADSPPHSAIREAAEVLWVAALTRKSGASRWAVMRSIQDFVFAVFSRNGNEADARRAARHAISRLAMHRKADRKAKPAKSNEGGQPREP